MVYRENTLCYADYAALRESVGWANFSPEHTAEALGRSLCDLTVYGDGRAVGMGRLLGDGLYDLIVDVVVRPEYQGRGLGGEIVRRLLDRAARFAPEGGRVSVQLIAERGKEPFYERLGFKRLPHAFCGPGMRKIILSAQCDERRGTCTTN